jgi:hypothetical protein
MKIIVLGTHYINLHMFTTVTSKRPLIKQNPRMNFMIRKPWTTTTICEQCMTTVG